MRFLVGTTADSDKEIVLAPIPLLDFVAFALGLRKALDGIFVLLPVPR